MKSFSQQFNPFGSRHLWDILIVLDACRLDAFKSVCKLEGELSEWYSKASCTNDFIEYFIDEQLEDVVCISGNPYISNEHFLEKYQKTPFHKVDNVWDWGWDKKLGTVRPDKMVEAVGPYLIGYADKKIYLHMIQPHHPFIGRVRIKEAGIRDARSHFKECCEDSKLPHMYEMLKSGKLDRSFVWQAYKDNLKLALKAIRPLLKLGKKVVITSDHGTCFGEHGIFAHPSKTDYPELTHVPWFEVKQ